MSWTTCTHSQSSRYYFLDKGGVWSSNMCSDCAHSLQAVKAKDFDDATQKLLPTMILKIYEKLYKEKGSK